MIRKLIKLIFPDLEKISIPINPLDECLNRWEKYRDQLIIQKRDLERQIDKIVFSISSGAIGISLIVIDKLSPYDNNYYVIVLIGIAWMSLVISLIYQCLSLLKSSTSIRGSITKVEEIGESDSLEYANEKVNRYYSDWQIKNTIIDKYNKSAFRFMIIGIIFLLSFSFSSLILKVKKPIQQINITLYDSSTNKILK